VFLLVSCAVLGQEKVSVAASNSEAAEGLDLGAVAELFKDSKNLEEFEKALNDPDTGINNLDLDDNGEVDFIRVVEEVGGDTHLIILQVPLAKDEFQDVATIEIEKTAADKYNMQVSGNEVIYGVNYYVAPAPAYVRIHTWPVISWIYRPVYRPYRSVFYFGSYPRWWRPYRPVTVGVYRTRTVRLTGRASFTVTRSRTVNVARVNYTPRSSPLVRKKTTVSHTTTTASVKKTNSGKTVAHGTKTTTKTTTTKTARKPHKQ